MQFSLKETIVKHALMLAISTFTFLPVLPLQAEDVHVSGPNHEFEPGWTLWRPRSEEAIASFSSGLSASEQEGWLEFQAACEAATELPNSDISYWFRLSNTVHQVGTGVVEYGCWQDRRFLQTYRSTAITNHVDYVDCLEVDSNIGNGLNIRSNPGTENRRIGVVTNGAAVEPDSFPASIAQADGRTWIAIRTPFRGWISNGSPSSQGNLKLCR